MIPHPARSHRYGSCAPRSRGDDPHVGKGIEIVHRVLPAHAGMIPSADMPDNFTDACSPLTRG